MDEYARRYMEPDERVTFREKVVSRAAFRVSIAFLLVFGLAGLGLIGAGAAGVVLAPVSIGLGALSLAFGVMMGVLGAMFSVFRSMVTTANVHVHFGWAKRKIPYAAIESVRAIELKGFRQGKVSLGVDGVVRTWVGQSSSGRGVEITYQEPGARRHVITIGSDEADRFVEAVERARAGVTGTGATTVRVETAGSGADEVAVGEARPDERRSAR